MYSQFKKKEAHPMEKYIGRHVVCMGREKEVVGYTKRPDGSYGLIIDSSQGGGRLDRVRAVRRCIQKVQKKYWYVSINDLIYQRYD